MKKTTSIFVLIVINILYIGIIISSGKIAMYLDKLSGRDFSLRVIDYIEPIEIVLVLVLLLISCIIIVNEWKN